MRYNVVVLYLLFTCTIWSQNSEKEQRKSVKMSQNFTHQANQEWKENQFKDAEATYRKAIAKNDSNAVAKYNLGTAYYKQNSFSEAFSLFKQAGNTAQTKEEKHKAYHNLGNVFMKNKEYEKAVETYKEALRNDPTDEETRYNLALAKEMLKKDQQENKDQKDNKDQKEENKDDNKNQDNKEEGDKDKDEKGENQDDPKDPNKNGEDNKNPKEGEGDKKDQGNEGDKKDEKSKEGEGQKPRPSQLSAQQIKNLLEAMSNEDKKVQEKINAKKVKGTPVKTEKDW